MTLSPRAAKMKAEQPSGNDAPSFRHRGRDVSRIEAFSDAVFGFAVTLLAISVTPPQSFADLMADVRGSVAFAACFFTLYQIWLHHYTFFRRYGLQDSVTIALNGVLLFVMLTYIYPLKFLFTLVIDGIVLQGKESRLTVGMTPADVPTLFVVYGGGFAAVNLLFFLLYINAWSKRDALELTPNERAYTRYSLLDNALMVAIGLISIVLAYLLPSHSRPLAGLTYFLIAPARTLSKTLEGNLERAHRRANPGTMDS